MYYLIVTNEACDLEPWAAVLTRGHMVRRAGVPRKQYSPLAKLIYFVVLFTSKCAVCFSIEGLMCLEISNTGTVSNVHLIAPCFYWMCNGG